MLVDQCQKFYKNLSHVAINIPRLEKMAAQVKPNALLLPTWTEPWCINAAPEKTLSWIFLFNSINYSYWSDSPWATTVRGKVYGADDPAYGVMAALSAALEHGTPLDDPKWLEQVDEDDIKAIFYPAPGYHPLSLITERVAALRELGEIFAHYGGAIGLLESCQFSASKLALFLSTQTETWSDSWEYKDEVFNFAKRAWMVGGMIYGRFLDDPTRCITDPTTVPCFSDYRLPQYLFGSGILEYDNALADKVLNSITMESGEPMEIELRIATQIAAQKLYTRLKERFPQVKSLQIDSFLWKSAVANDSKLPPHHRCRGTAY